MVSVYLRDEILREVMKVAQEENDTLKKQGKKPETTTGKVVALIVEDWYQNTRIEVNK